MGVCIYIQYKCDFVVVVVLFRCLHVARSFVSNLSKTVRLQLTTATKNKQPMIQTNTNTIPSGSSLLVSKIQNPALFQNNKKKKMGLMISYLMKMVVKVIANTPQNPRPPILRRPDEYGLKYEDVSFPASDGTNLEGWYMPAASNSNKIVICNHFSPGNRYGYAGHLKPWNNAGGFEVNFLPKYQALIDEGFNVLAYDMRNHGFSAPSQNGGYNPSFFEYKDILGSLAYVRERFPGMEIHLQSICLGGNSTLVAMRRNPEAFKGIKSMILVQPISGRALVRKIADGMYMGQAGVDSFEKHYREIWGYRIDDASPVQDAVHVKIPTFVIQVRNDKFTYAEEDVQAVYDAIPVMEKKLYWIEGTDERFKGYCYFSEQPQQMLDWYNKYS